MIKKILILVAMVGLILIHHSTFGQTEATKQRMNKGTISDSLTKPVLKSETTKVTIYDPLRYEYITGSVYMSGKGSSLRVSVLNCRDEGDEYVQIEVHAVEVAGPTRSPKVVNKTEMIKLPPQNIIYFQHNRRGDGTDGNRHEHWVKIKASSENLIPKVKHSYKVDQSGPLLCEPSYLPGDFAVYTRHPFKRIR